MFTVALIGPDGAGKTTIGRQLEKLLPLPVKYLYMGINADSSNHLLPTTRLIRVVKKACGCKPDTNGPRRHETACKREGGRKRLGSSLKSALRLTNRLSEEWFRQLVAWYYQRRRFIVLFDRHYFPDYYAYDIAGRSPDMPLSRKIHGYMLAHVYPKPDLVIYLDAPAEVLLARKGEGTLELLQQRREDYLQIRNAVKHFEVVNANRPADDVARDVSQCVWDFYSARSGKNRRAL